MRLFRYRPLSPLLFKELRYREVYLASAAELNDPLDLNAQIDFAPHGKEAWEALCAFLSDLFLEKLRSWRTEREWRIVQVHFQETIPEERIYNYASEALKGVFFGARMTDDAKRRVREALRWSGKPKFYRAIADGSQKVKFEPDEEQE